MRVAFTSEAARTAAEAVALAAVGTPALAGVVERFQIGRRHALDGYVRAELRFPLGVAAETATHLLADLAGALVRVRGPAVRDVLLFEVVGRADGITHFIELPGNRLEHGQAMLHASVPGLRIAVVEATPFSPAAAIELGLSDPVQPIRVDAAEAVSRSVLAAFQPLRAGEELRLVWIVANGGHGGLAAPTSANRQVDAALKLKQSHRLCWVVGRVGAVAHDRPRARQLVGRAVAALQSVSTAAVRLERRPISEAIAVKRMSARSVPSLHFPALLNARELATVIGWPLESASVPGLELVLGRPMPPSPLLPSRGRPVGIATYPGRERRIAQPYEAVTRHSWLVGPTGSGKSVLLVNQVLADLVAPGRRAVVLLDMKSDAVDAVLERFPPERNADLVVLDVRSHRPIGLNPLADADRHPEVAADQLFGIFKRLWHLDGAPRTSDLLHASLLTLAHHPGATVVDLAPLLTNAHFRASVTAQYADDPVLGVFWSSFAAMSQAERAQVVAPLLTRIRQVLMRSDLRVLLGQSQSALDLGNVINNSKVLLVPLAAGVIGTESAALLAAFLLSGLWSAAQARAAIPADRRRPASVFIDEWQVASSGVTDMTEVLSLARGYGVGFTLANQSPAQLPPSLAQAVAVNCRTKIVFATSATDASTLAKDVGVASADIQGLGRYEVIASVALGSGAAPPVSVKTQPLDAATRSAAELRRASADLHGRPRGVVEAEIRQRHQLESPTGEPGIRRRPS